MGKRKYALPYSQRDHMTDSQINIIHTFICMIKPSDSQVNGTEYIYLNNLQGIWGHINEMATENHGP